MVSVFICHGDHPGSKPVQSVCFRKVESYQNVIIFSPPVLMTGSPKAVHVLSCLCNHACERSLAICHKSRASCPVSRLLSVPMWPACAEQGHYTIQTNAMTDIIFYLMHNFGAFHHFRFLVVNIYLSNCIF